MFVQILSYFINEEIKDFAPLVVSIFCFFIFKMILARINKKRLSNTLINLLSTTLTFASYILFINFIGLPRFDYIFDVIPYIINALRKLILLINEFALLILILSGSNYFRSSLCLSLKGSALFIYCDIINTLFLIRIKIRTLINNFVYTYISNIHTAINLYKVNCVLTC